MNIPLYVADFETYYDDVYSLKKLTTEEYVRSPLFETIGLGLVNWGTKERWWLRPNEIPYMLKHIGPAAMCAHHAHFDGLILSHHYGYLPTFWFDTLSMANAMLPKAQKKGVKDLAVYFGIGEKGIEVELAKGKHYIDFSERDYQQYGRYCINDCDLEGKAFERLLAMYSPRAVDLEMDLIDITIRAFTEPTLMLDTEMLVAYKAREEERKAALFARTGCDKSIFTSGPKFATLLRDWGIEPEMKPTTKKDKATGERVASETFAFAKTDPFMQGLLESDRDEIRWFAEARVASKSTQALTRTERFIKIGRDERLVPVYYKYATAITDRWGGGDKMNWQNLGRVVKKKVDSGMLRLSVIAPPGKAIVVGDSSQVEARKGAVLSREEWMVEAFRQGRDIYSEFASDIYNRKIDRKKNEDDVLPGFVGKVGILGLGYGMGYLKAGATFLAGALGGEPLRFTEVDVATMQIDPYPFLTDTRLTTAVLEQPSRLSDHDKLIHWMVSWAIVERYRAKNRNMKAFWKYLGDHVIPAMHQGYEMELSTPIPLRTVRHGIELPNGKIMYYPGLEYDGKQYSYMGGHSGHERVKIYGGLLLENIDQALCRILVAEQMRRWVREFGRKMALTTHDEVGGVVWYQEAPQAAIELEQCMRTPSDWCPTMPVACEVNWGTRYGEIK